MNAALARKIDRRDAEIYRLTAALAKFQNASTDWSTKNGISQAADQQKNGLAEINARLEEALACARKTRGQINSSLWAQHPTARLRKSNPVSRIPQPIQNVARIRHVPTPPAENLLHRNYHEQISEYPSMGGHPQRFVARWYKPESIQA